LTSFAEVAVCLGRTGRDEVVEGSGASPAGVEAAEVEAPGEEPLAPEPLAFEPALEAAFSFLGAAGFFGAGPFFFLEAAAAAAAAAAAVAWTRGPASWWMRRVASSMRIAMERRG